MKTSELYTYGGSSQTMKCILDHFWTPLTLYIDSIGFSVNFHQNYKNKIFIFIAHTL